MRYIKYIIGVLILIVILAGAIAKQSTDKSICTDVQILATYEHYSSPLASLADDLAADPEAALSTLYAVGLSYQNLAINCGFVPETDDHHADDEGDEAADDHHDDESDQVAGKALSDDMMNLVMRIGDPENGKNLFTTFQTEVGFACATCHYTDSVDTLVGPGLQMIADPNHDHAMHNDMAMETEEATDEHGDMDMGTEEDSDEHGAMGMDDHSDTETDNTEDDIAAIMTQVDYIRTSIVDPGAFIVPGFIDNLMPKTYAEVFTEQEINDIIAFLVQNSLQQSALPQDK